MTDSSGDQYKMVQVLPHPHDLGYPLGYGNSLRCSASSCPVVDTNGLDPPCGMDSAPDYATSHQVVNPNGLDPPVAWIQHWLLLLLLSMLTVNGLDPPVALLTVNSWECSQQNPPLPNQGIKELTYGIQYFPNSAPTIKPSAALPPAFQEVGSQQNSLLPGQGVKGPTTGLRHSPHSAPTIKPSAALPPAFQEVGNQWSPEFSNGGVQKSHQDLQRSTKCKPPKTVRKVVPVPPMTFVSSATPEFTAVQNLQVTMAKGKARTVECAPSTPVSGSSVSKLHKCTVPECSFKRPWYKAHFLRTHLPSTMVSNNYELKARSKQAWEDCGQALWHLASLLGCGTLQGLVHMALQDATLQHTRHYPVVGTCAGFGEHGPCSGGLGHVSCFFSSF
ncbi:hypothetical protein PoB_005039500 [Plakobranchus ocellatus]|uniref:Uncharacterized protein n=1 Tax=Plakobranchus ocellatus TaxID=259542 RepID=A0AAV4BTW4_9GAST|nr:hypothetical protein PoB_005039500 [Plakobranchus ocellatus]